MGLKEEPQEPLGEEEEVYVVLFGQSGLMPLARMIGTLEGQFKSAIRTGPGEGRTYGKGRLDKVLGEVLEDFP